jgi:hypothetical protein
MGDRMKANLSTLWIFATLNYIYCDVLGLMDPNLLKGYLGGHVAGITVNQSFLLAAAVLVEVPMAMVLVSRFVTFRVNRWANVVAGGFMTLIQVVTLFIGTPTIYYLFCSVVEIGATASIVWLAWRWRSAPARAA